jgi:hypothetical protein
VAQACGCVLHEFANSKGLNSHESAHSVVHFTTQNKRNISFSACNAAMVGVWTAVKQSNAIAKEGGLIAQHPCSDHFGHRRDVECDKVRRLNANE